jgi:hypothetical protein
MASKEMTVTKPQTFTAALACGAIAVAAHFSSVNGAPASPLADAGRASASQPAVLELYQSQGCSSCPPALAVLNEIADRPDVLALNFAVTYWDQLGWKDSFAQPAFTARQWDYARAGGRSNVQTPQLIVDGRMAILGSRKKEVESAIANHRKVPGAPTIATRGSTVTIGAGALSRSAKVWLVDYDPHRVDVPINAGENGGRTLPHRNIVRQLTVLGSWSGKSLTLPLPRPKTGLARAILVQIDHGGPVLAGRKI